MLLLSRWKPNWVIILKIAKLVNGETRCRKRDRENYFKLVGIGINYLNIVRSIQKIEKKKSYYLL